MRGGEKCRGGDGRFQNKKKKKKKTKKKQIKSRGLNRGEGVDAACGCASADFFSPIRNPG